MKTSLAAVLLVVIFSAPAFAQGGNIGGAESRGEPINSSIRASGVNRDTGLTPGSAYHKRVVKKKRPRTVVQQPAPKGY